MNPSWLGAESGSQDTDLEWIVGRYQNAFRDASAAQLAAVKAHLALGQAFKATQMAFAKFLAPFDLTPTSYRLARLLYVVEDHRMPLTEIGKLTDITNTAVTKQIDSLERRGWVVRVANRTDRRVTYAELTEEGEAQMRNIIPAVLQFTEELLKDLNGSELEQITELLARLRLKVEERLVGKALSEVS